MLPTCIPTQTASTPMRHQFLIATLLLSAFTCDYALAAKAGTVQADGSRFVATHHGQRLLATAQDSPERLPWQDAVEHCERSIAHGHDDWRLPDAGELALLYRHRKAIDGFQDQEKDDQDPLAYMKILQGGGQVDRGYWSASRDDNVASGVDFTDGSTFELAIKDAPIVFSKWTRCVRTSR